MQEVFQPTHQEDQFILYLAIVLAIVGGIGLVLSLRKKATGEAHTRNMLVAMLLFFLTTISAGTALFSWLSMRKTGPVTITADAIETPYGKVNFKNIRNAEIITDSPVRLIPTSNGRGTVKLLLIEEDSGKAHVMSEENYDIQRIFGALREAMKG
ncbi:hypothetical protein [Flavilitoribacter nigricans]|uniref:Uncharacterized protein n=1 Tax=Flavilitoribacter nigricans (strain ATCC 23147 / DSM 23189 / NBRC 102662 / NCIMB 1420 / SS-2) TaxID=1122177 RepID=A0A2D0NE42_FLAN2|nr:hypothetical protein [Flavilitoribacter nigricans]PHN06737.1 hypothetical protein CRP01_10615 [Flavilitoribacter nigricans DSM 23189 = NBRC 102662]